MNAISDEMIDAGVLAVAKRFLNPTKESSPNEIMRGDVRAALEAALLPVRDKILTGNPKPGEELVAMLERRMGSMKLVGERDDLLLDSAIFIARNARVPSSIKDVVEAARSLVEQVGFTGIDDADEYRYAIKGLAEKVDIYLATKTAS
jgi:hypothetical protein